VPAHSVQLAHEVEGALGVGRALHVHADKVVTAGGVRNQRANVLVCQLLVDVQPHVRELEADVRLQAAGGDLVQQLVIESHTLPRFLGIGDVLPQVVDRDRQAEIVHAAGGSHRVVYSRAGDKTAGGALS